LIGLCIAFGAFVMNLDADLLFCYVGLFGKFGMVGVVTVKQRLKWQWPG
jgi:hypothetical protein